ncbi:MAG: adenylate cyclase [Sulfurimonas sp.]|nr:adenylate cyclase [Sulfurimonas sp.]
MNKDDISFHDTKINKNVVVLISDIRGFTSMSEKYESTAIVEMLNRYFNVMNYIIIEQYYGVIDKYIGDSIMAVFGMNDEENMLSNAIECAIEMQKAMDEINQKNIELGMPEIFMGIGISYGEVVLTRLGNALHSELTVIGDIVNLASRIEAFSLRGQVLLSEDIYLEIKESITHGDKHTAFVKGKENSIKFYSLFSSNINKFLAIPQREIRKSQRIDLMLAFSYQLLSSKHVLEKKYDAHTIDISYDGLLAQIYESVELYSEVKIKLFLLNNETSEIYAKVIRIEKKEEKIFAQMVFTSLDDVSTYQLHLFIDSFIQGQQ